MKATLNKQDRTYKSMLTKAIKTVTKLHKISKEL